MARTATTLIDSELQFVQSEAAVGRFVYNETPTGAVNGVNTTYTLNYTPTSGTVCLYEGQRRLKLSEDFTVSGTTITMLYAPPSGSWLLADYRRAP